MKKNRPQSILSFDPDNSTSGRLIDKYRQIGVKMIKSILEYWTIYLNLIGMSICFITIICLALKMIHQSKERRKRPFNEEIVAGMMKQHIEDSFETITNTVNKEYRAICSILDKGNLDQATKMLKQNNSVDIKKRSGKNASKKYSEILRLAGDGMGAKKISEAVRMPKGEVDLIIALQQRHKNGGHMDSSGKRAFA